MLVRERNQFQQHADMFTQDTYREFDEIRERGNRIRDEASAAIAAKDYQQFQERELISDEVMKLKQRKDILLSEFTIAQQDTIRADQVVHHEQRMMLIGKQKRTEDEAVVRSLMNEASSMESFMSIEQAKR